MTVLPSGGTGLFRWFNKSYAWVFFEIEKLVSLAVEAGRVSHLPGAHHGSLWLLRPGFCFAEMEESQGDERALVSCPSGLGYSARPRNLEVFPGSHSRNSRETKDLLQVTQEVCGGAGFLILNQYPDNQIYMALGEHTIHSGQHVDWVKEEIIKAGAWVYKGPLLIIY